MRDCGRITVIVPVYNVEKYIDRCVRSLVMQTYENTEYCLLTTEAPTTAENCATHMQLNTAM